MTQYESAFYAGTYLSPAERGELNKGSIAERRAKLRALAAFEPYAPLTDDERWHLDCIEFELEGELRPHAAIVSIIPATVPSHLEHAYKGRDGRFSVHREAVVALALRADGSVCSLTAADVKGRRTLASLDGEAPFQTDSEIAESDRWVREANARVAARTEAEHSAKLAVARAEKRAQRAAEGASMS